MTGCGEDKIDSLGESDYGTVALPNYNYADVAQDGNYNRNLFYRNDLEVKYGDPTTIYVDEGEWAGTFFTSGTSTGKSGKEPFRLRLLLGAAAHVRQGRALGRL